LRILGVAAAIAVAAYVFLFSLDQYLQHRSGPWTVVFQASPGGEPSLSISHQRKGIEEVTILFSGVTNDPVSTVVEFRKPTVSIPFGRLKHTDLTYLPGTVTLEVFGHEIELLPRTLYINRQEKEWRSGDVIRLGPWNRPPDLPEPLAKE